MDSKQSRLIIIVVAAFLVGWAIGLFLFGWIIWPVEWEGGGPEHLTENGQKVYLSALADLYSREVRPERIQEALGDWPEAEQAICRLWVDETDIGLQNRLSEIARVLNDTGCQVPEDGVAATAQEDGGGGLGQVLLVCGLLLLLVGLIAAIVFIWQRRVRQPVDEEMGFVDVDNPPLLETVIADQPVTPIARFETTYVRGHDTYDDSFSIENTDGDFLGECGVGLSDAIGPDTPKSVTAFEVWLFDKNDIRTVTKVVMSDHAFFDEAIKAKLAPKGEPILARPDETIVLETASLIVNAVISELEYGSGAAPPQSFFERFTVELSAWAKEADYVEPNDDQVDDMLDF